MSNTHVSNSFWDMDDVNNIVQNQNFAFSPALITRVGVECLYERVILLKQKIVAHKKLGSLYHFASCLRRLQDRFNRSEVRALLADLDKIESRPERAPSKRDLKNILSKTASIPDLLPRHRRKSSAGEARHQR